MAGSRVGMGMLKMITRDLGVFSSTTNPVRKEYTGSAPKCTNCNFHHHPEMPCRTCTNCNCLGNFAKNCREGSRMVNPLNVRDLTASRGACYKCGSIDHYKAACPRLNRAPGQGENIQIKLWLLREVK
ncbi:putative reverse transcriptase domain-containing protein, partial [Tanacetum coccineum]